MHSDMRLQAVATNIDYRFFMVQNSAFKYWIHPLLLAICGKALYADTVCCKET